MRTVISVTRKLRIASTREIEDTHYVGGHGTAWRGKLAQKIHFSSDKTALIPHIWSVWAVSGLVLQMLSIACGWLVNLYISTLWVKWREKSCNGSRECQKSRHTNRGNPSLSSHLIWCLSVWYVAFGHTNLYLLILSRRKIYLTCVGKRQTVWPPVLRLARAN